MYCPTSIKPWYDPSRYQPWGIPIQLLALSTYPFVLFFYYPSFLDRGLSGWDGSDTSQARSAGFVFYGSAIGGKLEALKIDTAAKLS
jgi:hypothetical protein